MMKPPGGAALIGALLGCLVATTVPAQTNTRITSFTADGRLAWTNVLTDHAYRIQSTRSLAQPWTNFGTSLQGTGATMTAFVPLTNSPAFYRIADLGSCCTNNGGTNFNSAVSLGSACGDNPPATFIKTGCGAGWYRVQITECQLTSGAFGTARNLKVNYTLTPAAGTDYDLFLYKSDGSLTMSSQFGGNTPEYLESTYADDYAPFPTFIPDTIQTYDVWIEVRRFSGTGCDNWTLKVVIGW